MAMGHNLSEEGGRTGDLTANEKLRLLKSGMSTLQFAGDWRHSEERIRFSAGGVVGSEARAAEGSSIRHSDSFINLNLQDGVGMDVSLNNTPEVSSYPRLSSGTTRENSTSSLRSTPEALRGIQGNLRQTLPTQTTPTQRSV